MLRSVLLVSLGVLGLSCGAVAQQNYLGGNLTFVDYSEQGYSETASLSALSGRLGSQFNENFSGEIRLGIGFGDDSVNISRTNVDIELENMFGAYIRGHVPTGTGFTPYVVAGFTQGELAASANGFSTSDSENDFSFGIGGDIRMSQDIGFNVEYMNYFDKNDAEISGFTVGMTRQF